MSRYRLPVPTRLDKFEVNANVKSWRIESFLRPAGGSNAYTSTFKVSHSGRDLVSVETTTGVSGSPGVDMIATTSIAGWYSVLTTGSSF